LARPLTGWREAGAHRTNRGRTEKSGVCAREAATLEKTYFNNLTDKLLFPNL
jgi:hypothetical protein